MNQITEIPDKPSFASRLSDPAFRKEIRFNLYLIPFDILVIVFIAQSMLPWWAVILLAAVNFGTWWCYYRIPTALRTTSGVDGRSILIPGPIVEDFAKFINRCGIHHRAHYGLMLAMMAGFHSSMTGKIWNWSIDMSWALALGWVSYVLLLLIDAHMFQVSLKTYLELRRDKLTEANKYTQELRRSNENLESFAYMASHDLRAPLRAINKLTGWIEEDVGDRASDMTRENFALLKKRIHRMDRLLEDLLQYSRVGREESEIETIDLKDLAMETFEMVRQDENEGLHVSGENIHVIDHSVSYRQIFANLIGNAIKHNDKEQPQIYISLGQEADTLILDIEDNGPGIEQKYREIVFDVFSTLERRDSKEASGIGLAIVKKIVEQKNGTIVLDESEYGGAKFSLRIPVDFAEAKS